MRGARSQSGLGLVEMLVSAAMMGVFLAALSSTFIATRRAYDAQETVSQRQQNVSASVAVLSYELGLAGYRGTSVGSSSTASFSEPTFEIDNGSLTVRYFEDRWLAVNGQYEQYAASGGEQLREVSFYVSADEELMREDLTSDEEETLIENVESLSAHYLNETGARTSDRSKAKSVSVKLDFSDDTSHVFTVAFSNAQQ